MKPTSKQPTKKSAKTIQGISQTTQITFIVTAIAAYVAQAIGLIQSTLSMQNVMELFTNWFPTHVFNGIIVPLGLFVFAYLLLNNSPSKVSRMFKATLVSVIGTVLLIAVDTLYMELFRQSLGYGATPPNPSIWTHPLMLLTPAVIAVVGTVFITVWVLKPIKDREFTRSRKVQKLFIAVALFSFVANALSGLASVANGANGGYVNANEALMSFVISTVILLIPIGFLYLIASKAQTKMTRLFNALLYILILMFVSVILFSIMFASGMYVHEPGSVGAIALPVIIFAVVVALVTVQKLQKAF